VCLYVCALKAVSRIFSFSVWNGFEAFLLYSPRTAPASFLKSSTVYFRFLNRSDSIVMIVSRPVAGAST